MPDSSILRHHIPAFVQEGVARTEAKLEQNFEKGLSDTLQGRDGVEFHVLSKGR